MQYSAVLHCIAQFSTAQHRTVKYSAVQYCTIHHSTVQYSTVQHCTAQHSTAQYSIAQLIKSYHSTAYHSTVFIVWQYIIIIMSWDGSSVPIERISPVNHKRLNDPAFSQWECTASFRGKRHYLFWFLFLQTVLTYKSSGSFGHFSDVIDIVLSNAEYIPPGRHAR